MSTYNRILVAVDLSPEARTVISRARELAQLYDAAMTLIHVVEPLVTMEDSELTPSLPLEIEKTLELRARNFLAMLAGELSPHGAGTVVKMGSPKREILKFARDNGFDLIVMGAHGRHGIATLLGSTANAVLHGTHCDVMCVRVGK